MWECAVGSMALALNRLVYTGVALEKFATIQARSLILELHSGQG